MNIITLCKKAITQNEVGDNLALAYQFSDPDGERTGKSGYSYGISQFDIENNWQAIKNLEYCGFRPKDLDRLFEQRGPIDDLNAKLIDHRAVVDAADIEHITGAVEHVAKFCGRNMSDETFVHLVDYHNQLDITPGGKMHTFIAGLGRMPTPQDVLNVKLTTVWGKKRKDDVDRRFDNISRLFD